MKSKTVINSAIERAENMANRYGTSLSRKYTYESVINALSVTNPNNTHILYLKVTTANPYDSSYLSNAIADESVDQLPIIMDTKAIKKYQAASPVLKVVSPNIAQYSIICGIIFMIILIGIKLLYKILDTSIKDEEDVKRYLGLNTLGIISDGKNIKKTKPKERENK